MDERQVDAWIARGLLWCADCREFFQPIIGTHPRRYMCSCPDHHSGIEAKATEKRVIAAALEATLADMRHRIRGFDHRDEDSIRDRWQSAESTDVRYLVTTILPFAIVFDQGARIDYRWEPPPDPDDVAR